MNTDRIKMLSIQRFSAFLALVLVVATYDVQAYTIPRVSRTPMNTCRYAESAATSMSMTNEENIPDPTNFREAEVLGLRLMQEGRFEEALVGMCENLYPCISVVKSIIFIIRSDDRDLTIDKMDDFWCICCCTCLSCFSFILTFSKPKNERPFCMISYLHLIQPLKRE